jgi:hypothetical protein
VYFDQETLSAVNSEFQPSNQAAATVPVLLLAGVGSARGEKMLNLPIGRAATEEARRGRVRRVENILARRCDGGE